MFGIIKSIRNNDLQTLAQSLKKEILELEQKWEAVDDFRLHGMNRQFVKHLLSRVSSYINSLVGKDANYVSYHHPKGRQFEIEHIWGNKFEEHKDEFDQKEDFQEWRNSVGALILLPNGTNQSFNSNKYEHKLKHYIKENTYAQTLHSHYYEKNPNFLRSPIIKELNFKPHTEFKKEDISARQELVKRICEKIWDPEYFENVE